MPSSKGVGMSGKDVYLMLERRFYCFLIGGADDLASTFSANGRSLLSRLIASIDARINLTTTERFFPRSSVSCRVR